MYAGGMLKGYERFRDRLSVREYAAKVMRGEVFDPTVSMQMRRGFSPRSVIENYAWDAQADHTGMLIVWERPGAADVGWVVAEGVTDPVETDIAVQAAALKAGFKTK